MLGVVKSSVTVSRMEYVVCMYEFACMPYICVLVLMGTQCVLYGFIICISHVIIALSALCVRNQMDQDHICI